MLGFITIFGIGTALYLLDMLRNYFKEKEAEKKLIILKRIIACSVILFLIIIYLPTAYDNCLFGSC
jgi:Na+/proline symporter